MPPELDQRPWRRFLCESLMTSLAVRLHQPTSDSERWAEQLAFRDVLGRDPALTQRYAALTQALAAEHTQDREAYPAAKMEFVRASANRSADPS